MGPNGKQLECIIHKMKIKEEIEGSARILHIYGNMAMDENAELKKLLQPYLEDASLTGIILDLKNVGFIDSSGVGLIVGIYKTLQRAEKRFVLMSLNDRHREILNITQLDKILTIAEDRKNALEAFAAE